MSQVRKSVSFHPQAAEIVRITQISTLIREDKGERSEAVNRIIFAFFLKALRNKVPEEEIAVRIGQILDGSKPITHGEFEQFRGFLDKIRRRMGNEQ